ncbi:hypothetical protein ACFQ2B_33320 [Streptomyces stramineus]
MFSDAARGPLIALVPILHAAGLLTMPVFMVLLFAVGSFFAPYVASQQAVLPALVGDDEALLSKANARLQGATRLTILLGPHAAGLLIAVMGAPAVLLLDALSFTASALLLRRGLPRGLPLAPARAAAGCATAWPYWSRTSCWAAGHWPRSSARAPGRPCSP